jgi:hypothetical protein
MQMPTTVDELLADLSKGVVTVRVGEDGNSFTVSWIPDSKGRAQHEVIDDIHQEFERLAGSEDAFWQCILKELRDNPNIGLGRAMLKCLHRVL